LQELAGRKYVSPYYEARIYAGLGDKERVFQLLKKAYEERSDHLLHLQNDPVFDALRKEPQFIELLGRIGLGS
jgi:adenylate cyclase